jgi:hypothetical protein
MTWRTPAACAGASATSRWPSTPGRRLASRSTPTQVRAGRVAGAIAPPASLPACAAARDQGAGMCAGGRHVCWRGNRPRALLGAASCSQRPAATGQVQGHQREAAPAAHPQQQQQQPAQQPRAQPERGRQRRRRRQAARQYPWQGPQQRRRQWWQRAADAQGRGSQSCWHRSGGVRACQARSRGQHRLRERQAAGAGRGAGGSAAVGGGQRHRQRLQRHQQRLQL